MKRTAGQVKFFTSIILAALLITSCAAQPSIDPTATHAVPKVTTQLALPAVLIQCPTRAESSSELGETGRVVLVSDDKMHAQILDLSTNKMSELPNSGSSEFDFFAQSPDQHWLAYRLWNGSSETSKLVFYGADGEEIEMPWDRSWAFVVAWLNDSILLVNKVKEAGETLDSLLAINPFTGEVSSLPKDFPDIYYLPPSPDWGPYLLTLTVFSQDASKVVYPIFSPGDGSEVVLWDVTNAIEVARVQNTDFFGRTPTWSPRGQEFLIPLSVADNIGDRHELFSVDVDGELAQLTKLAEAYDDVSIGYYSWAPDARKVALWIESNPAAISDLWAGGEEHERLAIFDFGQNVTVNTCLPGNVTMSLPPIWSPTSKSVLVGYSPSEGETISLILNTEDLVAFEIAEGWQPVAWITGN